MKSQKRIIYDFGANNGNDIPYYLLKSDLIVAVEANPILCDIIKDRFPQEIAEGKLIVENCVITVDSDLEIVPFFIHKNNHGLSQFPSPDLSRIDNFYRVQLPARDVISIIKSHGDPYYIKIDIEHFDRHVLRRIFLNNIFPPYISSESHCIDIFCLFVALGQYESFKLIDGASVPAKYANQTISTSSGSQLYTFPHRSSGPFGNDINGDWMSKDNFVNLLMYARLGWKDIHASNVDLPNVDYAPSPEYKIEISIDY